MTKHVSKLLAFLSAAVLLLLTVALAPMFSQAGQALLRSITPRQSGLADGR